MQDLTVEDLAQMIRDLHNELRERSKSEEEFRRVLILLANQAADLTHATVETAAKIKGVSTRTIRERIARKEYTLEVIPGKRGGGIPIEQLSSAWVPIAIAKRFHQKRQKEAQHVATQAR